MHGIDDLQSKEKGCPAMKKESGKQSKQKPIEGICRGIRLKWKMRIKKS